MPELPEITVIARQMNRQIAGKQVAEIEAKQPKNLNMPVAEFTKAIVGKTRKRANAIFRIEQNPRDSWLGEGDP